MTNVSDANAFQNLYRDLLESQKAWRCESAKAQVSQGIYIESPSGLLANVAGARVGVFAVSTLCFDREHDDQDTVNESKIVALLDAWDTTPRLLEKVFEEDKSYVDNIVEAMEDVIVKWPKEKYTQASITHLVQKFQSLKGYEIEAGLVQSHLGLAIVTSTIERELHATEGQTELEELQHSMKQLKVLGLECSSRLQGCEAQKLPDGSILAEVTKRGRICVKAMKDKASLSVQTLLQSIQDKVQPISGGTANGDWWKDGLPTKLSDVKMKSADFRTSNLPATIDAALKHAGEKFVLIPRIIEEYVSSMQRRSLLQKFGHVERRVRFFPTLFLRISWSAASCHLRSHLSLHCREDIYKTLFCTGDPAILRRDVCGCVLPSGLSYESVSSQVMTTVESLREQYEIEKAELYQTVVQTMARAMLSVSEAVLIALLVDTALPQDVCRQRIARRLDKIAKFTEQHSVDVKKMLLPIIVRESVSKMVSAVR
eukprot:6490832-Amphidinium_carterae.1